MILTWEKWLERLSPQSRRQQESFSEAGSFREEPSWHLVIVRDGEWPDVETPPSFSALRHRLMQLGPDTRVIPFFGLRADISDPVAGTELRYLVHPDGTRLPLFDAAQELTIDRSGRLGPPDEDVFPLPTRTPAAEADVVDEEEEEFEEDEIDADVDMVDEVEEVEDEPAAT